MHVGNDNGGPVPAYGNACPGRRTHTRACLLTTAAAGLISPPPAPAPSISPRSLALRWCDYSLALLLGPSTARTLPRRHRKPCLCAASRSVELPIGLGPHLHVQSQSAVRAPAMENLGATRLLQLTVLCTTVHFLISCIITMGPMRASLDLVVRHVTKQV